MDDYLQKIENPNTRVIFISIAGLLALMDKSGLEQLQRLINEFLG